MILNRYLFSITEAAGTKEVLAAFFVYAQGRAEEFPAYAERGPRASREDKLPYSI